MYSLKINGSISLLFLLLSSAAHSQNVTLQTVFPETNGTVSAIAVDSNNQKLYIGGNFTSVGYKGRYAALLDTNRAFIQKNWAYFPNGPVYASEPDSLGGVYVGGDFTRIHAQTARSFAHYNKQGIPDTNNTMHFYGGKVSSIARSGSQLFIGGTFNLAGHKKDFSSYGAVVNLDSGYVQEGWPAPNGTVRASMPDGNGGWFIGGDFTRVGQEEASGFAHLLPNKKLDTAFGGFYKTSSSQRGQVLCITRLGNNRIVVGGDFQLMANKPNGKIPGSLVLDSGLNAVSMNIPSVQGIASRVISDGRGGWFVAGSFTAIGDKARNNLAHINAQGQLSNWNPNVNGLVNDLVLDGSRLIIGGSFTQVGGQSRQYLAMLDTSNAQLNGWNPAPDASVYRLAVYGHLLIVHGAFNTIAGTARGKLAAFSRGSSPVLSNWNPGAPSNSISQMIGYNGQLYLSGFFTAASIGGQTCTAMVAVDTVNGLASNWDPQLNNGVRGCIISGNKMFIQGDFTQAGGQSRNKLASFDLGSGLLNNWNPLLQSSGSINCMAMVNNRLYFFGADIRINSVYRNGLIICDTANGAVDLMPKDLAINGNIFYDGSSRFLCMSSLTSSNATVLGKAVKNIAVLNITNGQISPFHIQPNNMVSALDASNGIIYMAGSGVTQINGIARSYIAAFDSSSGSMLPWNPNPNGAVLSILANKNLVYLGGMFTNIAGQARNRIACIDSSGTLLSNFNPNATASSGTVTVSALALYNGNILAGGSFQTIGTQSRSCIAMLDSATGNATVFNATLSSSTFPLPNVYSIAVVGNTVYACGYMTSAKGLGRSGLFAYNVQNNNITGWHPVHSGNTWTISSNGSSLYIGGSDTLIGGFRRNGLVKYDEQAGQMLSSWNPGLALNTAVNALLVKDTTLVVGGVFSSVNSVSRTYLATLHTHSAALGSLNPIITGIAVNALELKNDTLYIGGDFFNVNGQTRNKLASLNLFTGTLHAWNPSVNGEVNSILATGNTIYIGGAFTSVSSVGRVGLASFTLPSASPDPLSVLFTGSRVYDIALRGSNLFLAGESLSTSLGARNGLAIVNLANSNRISIWNPCLVAAPMYTLVASDSLVFAGGAATSLGLPYARRGLARIDLQSMDIDDWNPGSGSINVRVIKTHGNRIYIGGLFSTMAGQTRNNIAAFDRNSGSLLAWDPNASSTVSDILPLGDQVYLAGSFIGMGAQTRYSLARVDSGTALAASWNPNVVGGVSKMILMGNKLFIGGSISSSGAQSRDRLAAIDLASGNTLAWNPSFPFSSYRNLLGAKDSLLLVSSDGDVYTVDTAGTATVEIALNGEVKDAEDWSGRRIFGGSFTNSSILNLGMYNSVGTLFSGWLPNPNNLIQTLCVYERKVYVAGNFTEIGGVSKSNMAAVYLPATSFSSAVFKQNICRGASLPIQVSSDIEFKSGNVFTAQLSDSTGSFNNPISIGTISATQITGINASIPLNLASGTRYRVRVLSSNPAFSSDDNGSDLIVKDLLSMPDSIRGDTLRCQGDTVIYFTRKVKDALFYNWSVPQGWIIVGSSSDTLVRVKIGQGAGQLRVAAADSCGQSLFRSLQVYSDSVTAQPSAIQGSNLICRNSTHVFKINKLNRPVTYQWTVPAGWTIQSGQGDTAISVLCNTSGGTLSVSALNACGSSPARSMQVNVDSNALDPLAIYGDSIVCKSSLKTFHTPALPGAQFSWSIPSGWSFIGSSTDTLIQVQVGATAGSISVSSTYTCGLAGDKTKMIAVDSVPAKPLAVSGPTLSCAATSRVFEINPIAGANSYSWTLPQGWTLQSGAGTRQISALTAASGTLYVHAVNNCGQGDSASLSVSIHSGPQINGSLSGDSSVCAGVSKTYSINPIANVLYTWSLPSGWAGSSGSNSIQVNTSGASGLVKITVSDSCGSDQRSLQVNVTPAVVPSASITVNPSSAIICSGSLAEFTAQLLNEGSSPVYNWQVNNISVHSGATFNSSTLADKDTVSLLLSSSALCANPVSVRSNKIVMSVLSLPAKPVISAVGSQLSSSAASGNQWYYGGQPILNATAATYTAIQSGWYQVKVSSVNGCYNISDSVYVLVSSSRSGAAVPIRVYPLPFSSSFYVDVPAALFAGAQTVSLRITDVPGRQFMQKQISSPGTQELSLAHLPAGAYLLELQYGQQRQVFKIMKQ